MPDPDGDGEEVWVTEGDDDVRRVSGLDQARDATAR
jgi:hypothetical protein